MSSLGDIPPGLIAAIVITVVILIIAVVTLLVVVYLKLRNKSQNDTEDHSLSATETQVLQVPPVPVASPCGPNSSYSHPGFQVPNYGASRTDLSPVCHMQVTSDFEYVNSLGPNPPLFSGPTEHSSTSPRSLSRNQNPSQGGDPHYASPRSPIKHRGISREEDPHYVSPRSPGNSQDSSWEEGPHYVSPRSPINRQDISWTEEPHYVSPRAPNDALDSSWKEDPHYVSPRSPINLQDNSWKEDSHRVSPPSPTPHSDDSWQDEPLYANYPSQTVQQDVDHSFSNKSLDQSPYDCVGKPRPVQADGSRPENQGSRGLSTRRFASPFARAKESKSCEETEPVYANT